MRTGAFGVLACGIAVGFMQTGAALACGASAPPFYVVKQQSPVSAATPLNTPLVVTVIEDADGPVVDSFNPSLTLTKADSDLAIELKALGGLTTLSWVPLDALEPETTYEAHFNPGYEGIPDTIWTFTTGTESTPALSLEGKLEVTLEPGSTTVYTCPNTLNPCGPSDNTGCPSQVVEVTQARVKIPRAVSGFPERLGTVTLTDDLPFDFSPPSKTGPEPYRGQNVSVTQYVNLDDPSLSEVLITLPDEAAPYKPCFAFAASDARGDQAIAEPLCLDVPASPVVTENDGDPGLGNDMKKSGTSEGCNVGRAPSSNSAWLGLLVPLAIIRGRRRRRPTPQVSAARRP